MTKKQMLKEIKFPVLAPSVIDYINMYVITPVPNAWIICFLDVKGHLMQGLYKWQNKNNPNNITGWAYIKLDSTTGTVRFVKHPYLQDEKVIIICHEKYKHLIIKS